MANIEKLRDELINDPLTRGYAAMTDAEVLSSLNVDDRTIAKSAISGEEMWQQTNEVEFANLTDSKKQMWVSFTRSDGIDPFATANVEFVKWIFGTGAQTVTNLVGVREYTGNRIDELELGEVTERDVHDARAS